MGLFNKFFKKSKKHQIKTSPSTVEFKYCVNCGHKINKSAKKCPYCNYNFKTMCIEEINDEKLKIENAKKGNMNFENIDGKLYQIYKETKKHEIFDEEKETQKRETLQETQKRLEIEIGETASSIPMIGGKEKYAEISPVLTAKSSSLRSVRYEILDEDHLDFETRGKQYMNCQGQDSKYIKICGQIDYYKKEGKNLEKALELSYEATDYLLLETDWGIDDKYTQGYLNGKPILKNGKILGCGAAAQEIKTIEDKIKQRTKYYQVYKRPNKRAKQGYSYVYEYFENYKLKTMSSTDIKKLEKKVKGKNLTWKLRD